MRNFFAIFLSVIILLSFSGCKSSEELEDTLSNLDASVQSDISSVYTSSQDTTTSIDDLESGQSSSEESKPQSLSDGSSKMEVNKPTEKVGEYTVTFNYGYDNKKITTKSQNYKVSKPEEPTRKGYKFLGWYADDETEQWSFSGHTVTTDMTLTAKWGKHMYGISYLNVVDGKETDYLKEGEAWYDSNSSSTSSDFTSTESKEPERGKVIIFEKHSLAVYNDIGFVDMFVGTNSTISVDSRYYDIYKFRVPDSFSVDTETFTIPELNVAGYTFLGWTYDGQATPVKTVTIPKGTTKGYRLVANWQS